MRVLPPLKLASLLLAAFSLPSAHAQQYDAIVIGSGPGGLVAAEYLSRDPTVSVLILEAGLLSLAATGGTDSPDYAVGSGLTKFDIPGEYDNTIYNSANDKYRVDWINGPYMWLGKLVGGCSSINAALYFRPPDSYVTNMQWPFSAARVASLMDENEKIHGATDKPSPDGQWYTQEGYNIVSNVLRQYAGYSEKTINDAAARNSKAKTFGHAPFTFKGGKRDTPANAFWSLMKNRSNVKLIASATVNYIIHSGAVATGVVYNSNVQVGLTGRGAVLMAAGAMSTPKVLIQSGIGPSDQLNMLNRADFPGIQRGGWVVNNNVGKSLFDTNVVFASFSHPDMTSFQYKTKPASAINQYMANGAHTGAWASSGPTLVAYDTYAVNGRSYDFQITVLTNGFGDYYGNSKAFTTSLYVNNPEARAASGFSSDGKWNAFVSGDAYFGTTNDLNAMQSYATKVVDWMKQGGATFLSAANGQSTASWVAANDGFITHHFGGSCYASSNANDAKRCADEKLRVVGTTNVFVADGSAMRDGTVNPYGFIMYIGREAASQAQAYIASGNPNPSTCSAIENGVDYTGNDIGSAASATAANCCNVCSSTSGCGAFSWTNYNGGTCWLKSGKGATTTAAGVTSGVVSTSSSNCSALVNNVDYAGNDIGNAASGAATGCCALCKAQSGCKAYTWTNYNGGTCWLKSAKGATSTVTGAISGEVSSSSTSSCSAIEENVDYTGNDVGNAASATADNCCTLCKAQAGCGAFTWTNYNGGMCWLKSGKGATTTKSGARSAVLTTSTPTCTLVNNVDYYGNDLASAASSTAANCCTLCRARTGCKAFTWTDASGGTCWLKTVQGASTTKAGAVSGTI